MRIEDHLAGWSSFLPRLQMLFEENERQIFAARNRPQGPTLRGVERLQMLFEEG